LFGFRLRRRSGEEMLAHLFGSGNVNRAGVRFLFRYAGLRQIVDDCFCLDLQLAGQFVDSDLIRVCH
jgi:hypothetical protein